MRTGIPYWLTQKERYPTADTVSGHAGHDILFGQGEDEVFTGKPETTFLNGGGASDVNAVSDIVFDIDNRDPINRMPHNSVILEWLDLSHVDDLNIIY